MTNIIIPYSPRPYQWDIHKALDTHRWSVIIMHRRAGKTVLLINHLVRCALLREQKPNEPPSRFAYVAPYLRQAKSLAWGYLKQYTDPLPNRVYSETDLKVTLPNGAEIRLFGADNAEALRGIYLDGCVLDEYAHISPDVFNFILRPALTDRLGWCVFSGTPNGKDHLYKQLRYAEDNPSEWWSCVLPATETGIIPQKELDDALRAIGQEAFDREYLCSFDSIQGKKIFPEFHKASHVARESLYPTVPTTILRGWDNTGLSPACVLTYLTNTGQWRVFKEFCFSDTGIMEAVESVVIWCNTMLPQGCRFQDYTDPAGSNRDTMKMSPKQYMIIKAREMGCEIRPVDGIQTWKVRRESIAGRLRQIRNGEPSFLIDRTCETLIEGFMGAYAYRELAQLPGQYAEEAVKNHVSHIHDALQYVATRLFLASDTPRVSYDGSIYDEEDDYQYQRDLRSGKNGITGY